MGENCLPPPLLLSQVTRFDNIIQHIFVPFIIKCIIPTVFYTFKLYRLYRCFQWDNYQKFIQLSYN